MYTNIKIKSYWVFATNSNIIIPVSLQPNGVNLSYLEFQLFDLTKFLVQISNVHNIGLQRYSEKIRICGITSIPLILKPGISNESKK